MFRHAVRPLLALAIALAPASANAALYRWVDEQGVTHYTTDLDSIPGSARDNALEIVTSPAPVETTRALPVPPVTPEVEPTPPPAAAPEAVPMPPIEAEPPPPIAIESPPLEPATPEPAPTEATPTESTPTESSVTEPAATPAVGAPAPSEPPPAVEPTTTTTTTEPPTATEPAPSSEWTNVPSSAPVFPGPSATPPLSPDDPRGAEVAELEAKIAADREQLRQMISTKRWDSAELASDPNIREIAERLPRLQAELAALRAETVP